MKDEIIICKCAEINHCCIITYNEEDKEVYLNIHLNRLSFWKRLIYGIKYIFGHRSTLGEGAFAEVIVGEKDWKKFKKISYMLKPESIENNPKIRKGIEKIVGNNKKQDYDVHL